MILSFGVICSHIWLESSDDVTDSGNILATTSQTSISGSAALQAIAAARAGAKTSLTGTIGNDNFAKDILTTLRREGINTSAIAKHEEQQTALRILISSPNGKTLQIHTNNTLHPASADQIPQAALNARTLILLQNDIPAEINVDIMKRARTSSSKTILSIHHDRNITSEILALADFIIAPEPLIQLYAPHNEKGTAAPDEKAIDCFCGTLAACYQAAMPKEKALDYARAASKIASKQNGTYTALPYLDDIEKNL